MKIFIAMINDRHTDPEPFPFTTAEDAINFARTEAYEYAHTVEDVEETNVDGWLYSATYSPEGDSVWVIEKELK